MPTDRCPFCGRAALMLALRPFCCGDCFKSYAAEHGLPYRFDTVIRHLTTGTAVDPWLTSTR